MNDLEQAAAHLPDLLRNRLFRVALVLATCTDSSWTDAQRRKLANAVVGMADALDVEAEHLALAVAGVKHGKGKQG